MSPAEPRALRTEPAVSVVVTLLLPSTLGGFVWAGSDSRLLVALFPSLWMKKDLPTPFHHTQTRPDLVYIWDLGSEPGALFG